MDQIFFEDIHQQFENTKALIKEKGVQLKLVDDTPESLEKLREAWRKHEIKEMFDAMTGRLVARLQGMKPEEDHYFRVLGMQGALLYEEAKIFTSLEDSVSASSTLETALQMVRPHQMRIEIIFLALRIMNHYSYLMISKDINLDYAQILLQEAETLYNRLHLSGKSASIFFNTDDLFSCEIEAELHLPISGKLEKLATNNMQMLGYIFHKRGLMDKFVLYHHCVLNRHLELQDHDPLGWATKAERLACYFLRERRFGDARHHLTAAWTVVSRMERITKAHKPTDHALAALSKIDYMYCRLAGTWVRYGSELFGYSRLALLRALGRGADDAIWGTAIRLPTHTSAEVAAADVAAMTAAAGRPAQGEQEILEEDLDATVLLPDSDACSEISLPAPRISGLSLSEHHSLDALGVFASPDCCIPEDELIDDLLMYPHCMQGADMHMHDPMHIAVPMVIPPLVIPTCTEPDSLSQSPTSSQDTSGVEITSMHSEQSASAPDSPTTATVEAAFTKTPSETEEQKPASISELEVTGAMCPPSIEIVSEVLAEITTASSASPEPVVDQPAPIESLTPQPGEEPLNLDPNLSSQVPPLAQCSFSPLDDGACAGPSINTDEDIAAAAGLSEQPHAPQLIFEMLHITNAERKVPANIIDSALSARALFNHTYEMLKIAKRYHNVRDHPEDYEHWALTLCDLYDFLSFYEQDIYTQYELQRRRAETLETLTAALRRVRPDYYVHVSVELLRELAGAQLELLELNFRRLFCAQQPPPPPTSAAAAAAAANAHVAAATATADPGSSPKSEGEAAASATGGVAAAPSCATDNPAGQAAAAHALNKLRAFADVKDRLDVFGEKQQQQMEQQINLTAAGDTEQY